MVEQPKAWKTGECCVNGGDAHPHAATEMPRPKEGGVLPHFAIVSTLPYQTCLGIQRVGAIGRMPSIHRAGKPSTWVVLDGGQISHIT